MLLHVAPLEYCHWNEVALDTPPDAVTDRLLLPLVQILAEPGELNTG